MIVCNTDFTFNKFIIPLVNNLTKDGCSVGVICDGDKININELNSDVKFHNILIPRKASLIKFISSIFAIRKVINENNYELVNSNNRNASFLTRLAILTMPFSGVRSIYTARGMYFHDSQGFLSYSATYWLEVFLLLFTDTVMSQSQQDVDKMSKNPLVNSSKLQVIHNGIDEERFSINNINSVDLKPQGFVICTIGRIASGKGLFDLLEAFSVFSKNKNTTLLIIGGVLHHEYNELLSSFWVKAEQLEIREKILITGLVDNVQDYLATADLYIHPSYREGVPRAILEAMSLEKIVIATNIRGASEIVNNGLNGILYDKGNVKDLIAAIERVSKMTKSERLDYGLRARKRVIEKYTEKSYIDRQVRILTHAD